MSVTEIFQEPCDTYYKVFNSNIDSGYKYRFLSPFEFKNKLISIATKNVGSDNVLNAGRGNPNFFAKIPRIAFSELISICTNICQNSNSLTFVPEISGIYKKFNKALKQSNNQKFLVNAINRMKLLNDMDLDQFAYSIVISTLGTFYPNPPRIQPFAESVLTEFIEKRVYRCKKNLQGKISIFPTEGAANAIIYVFNTLKYNDLVKSGDTIGILTPIFSPYIELPNLKNYNLTQICINSCENNWEIPDSELEKIGNPKMRALFLVNPTNPTSVSLSAKTVRKIASVIRYSNPNIIILSDNVYAPFCDEFNSLFSILPRNTIGVYSFSKYFGVTGWRLGLIAIHNNNIIDSKLLKAIPKKIHERYNTISNKPQNIKFIDRLLADSRQISEAHVAGLSTPQQMQMCLFAMFDIIEGDKGYRQNLKNLLLERLQLLLKPLNISYKYSVLNTNYYILLNIPDIGGQLYNNLNFKNYLNKYNDPLEFLLKLAKEYGTVLLPGIGFAGPFWSVRVSLANLSTNDYKIIGENIKSLINKYYIKWKKIN